MIDIGTLVLQYFVHGNIVIENSFFGLNCVIFVICHQCANCFESCKYLQSLRFLRYG